MGSMYPTGVPGNYSGMRDNWVNNYIGTEYVKNGRNIKTGFDCWGLVLCVYRDVFHVELPDFSYTPTIFGYLDAVEYGLNLVYNVSAPVTGDIVLMRIKNAPIHTGLYVAPERVLHCYNANVGTVLDKLKMWQNQIVGFYRFNNGSNIA